MENFAAGAANGESRSVYGWLAHWTQEKPQENAIVLIGKKGYEAPITWAELKQAVDKTAAHYKRLGVKTGDRVVVTLPNSLAAVTAAIAAWHMGCCVFFLSNELPGAEMAVLLDQIKPDLVAASAAMKGWKTAELNDTVVKDLPLAEEFIEDISAVPARATTTGGSTGIPKIIIEDIPMNYGPTDFYAWQMLTGQHSGQTQLICGSLHHSLFGNSFYMSLAMGNTQLLMCQFREDLFIKLVGKYRVNSFVLVPTMMSRIIRSPEMETAELGSIECMHHAGASCPVWLKKEWIERLGGEKVHEFYSMSEKIGMTGIRGDEWLLHEGSVGRPFGCEIEIFSDEMEPVPAGTIGNVYFKSGGGSSTHYLLGEQRVSQAPDGALSVGDLGYLDEEGYLFLVDRRSDMIITGGKNVYAAEVENLLREFDKVADILVIGLPDATWGRRVHAIIEPACPAEEFPTYAFADFGFRRISNYKLPKTIELVKRIPRDHAGKVNKRKLAEEREKAGEDSELFKYIKVPNGHQLMAWRKKKNK